MLTLARQDPGETRTLADLGLLDVLREVVARHAPMAAARGIELGLDVTTDTGRHARVHGDAQALQTLFGNLVDNALKYTPRGGRVDVRLVSAWPAVVEVEDNGPGIAADERERVFDRFYRRIDDAAGPSNIEGSGLGLAIVRNIADVHHAQVTLHDAREGHGLRVRVGFDGAPTHIPPAL
ncbi:hypothetical protein GCM10027419_22810 [Pandoraea terrae]